MNFALLTESPFVTAAVLESWAPAFAANLAAVANAWRSYDASVAAGTLRVVDAASQLRDDEVPIVVVRSLPGFATKDLAFHWVADRYAYGLVLADGYQSTNDVQLSTDHEIIETLVDPGCDRFANGDALEIADPVQEDAIGRLGAGDTAVTCSAFVTPAWFRLGEGATVVSTAGIDLAPGALAPGGYKVRQDGSQVPPHYRAPWTKHHPLSRAERRRRKARP